MENHDAEIEEPRFGETNPRGLRVALWRNEPEVACARRLIVVIEKF